MPSYTRSAAETAGAAGRRHGRRKTALYDGDAVRRAAIRETQSAVEVKKRQKRKEKSERAKKNFSLLPAARELHTVVGYTTTTRRNGRCFRRATTAVRFDSRAFFSLTTPSRPHRCSGSPFFASPNRAFPGSGPRDSRETFAPLVSPSVRRLRGLFASPCSRPPTDRVCVR